MARKIRKYPKEYRRFTYKITIILSGRRTNNFTNDIFAFVIFTLYNSQNSCMKLKKKKN